MAAGCAAQAMSGGIYLVSPNISRFIQLMQAYPKSVLQAVGDNEGSDTRPWTAVLQARLRPNVLLVDVNLGGMDHYKRAIRSEEATFMDLL